MCLLQASHGGSSESDPIIVERDPVHVKDYSYSVKIINPQKKSEYSMIKWRVKQRFKSVEDIKKQLKKGFENELPGHENIEFGYIRPGHGARGKQQWIVSMEDLDDMYCDYSDKKEVLLWAFGSDKTSGAQRRKRSCSPTQEEVPTVSKKSRSKYDSHAHKMMEVETIVDDLTEKHGGKFSQEQLNVWAHLAHMKKHQSFEDPPDKQFFKGKGTHKSQKTTTMSTSMVSDNTEGNISPFKRINLRNHCMDQLEKWHSLYEKGAVSQEQYERLQGKILTDIDKL